MHEIRRAARVMGPGRPGHIQVKVLAPVSYAVDVPVERIPESLRAPNSELVVVTHARDVLRVEGSGKAWLAIQDSIREVLNSEWDPIGVAAGATPDDPTFDEYDSYIAGIYGLLRKRLTVAEIAAHLQRIEVERMGIQLPDTDRNSAAAKLRALLHPTLG